MWLEGLERLELLRALGLMVESLRWVAMLLLRWLEGLELL